MADQEITLDNFDELWPEPTIEEMIAASRVVRQTPYGLQDGNGVDVSLIIENLRHTPEERSERAYFFTQGMIRDRMNAKRIR
jgi:hypothetical protein